jgi:hypothetical protein
MGMVHGAMFMRTRAQRTPPRGTHQSKPQKASRRAACPTPASPWARRHPALVSPPPALSCRSSDCETVKPTAIALRRPSFAEITAAAVMAAGLWCAAVALLRAFGWALGAGDAGALLVVVAWGCLSVRVGVDLGKGGRHLMVHLLVSAALLGTYDVLRSQLA